MEKSPNDPLMQEVGQKLIKRIGMTLEEEKNDAEKEKDDKIEKARIRMIADNEEQLDQLKTNLDKKMKDEEQKLTE